jgi:hypothetical protein
VGAIGLDRDRDVGWDFGGPVGVAPVGGAAMIGFRDCGAAGLDIRVGIPAVTVVIEFGENDLIVDNAGGRHALTGFVSGFLSGTMRVRSERVECVEVRLSPARAYASLGVPPTDLGCAVVGLEDLWGRRAMWLRERLADAVTWEERFALTRSFLMQCDEPTRTLDPEVIPHWLSRRTLKGSKLSPRYVTPPMPFGLNTEEARELVDTVPGVVAVVDVAMPAARGLFKWITRPVLDQIGWWRRNRPSITLLEFG